MSVALGSSLVFVRLFRLSIFVFYWFSLDYLWPPYVIGQAIIFLPCGFFFYLSTVFPRLISAVADWMSAIVPHMVWP